MANMASSKAQSVQRLLSGRDKVAAILLALSKPAAARLLKYFDEQEIRELAKSAAGLGIVPRKVLDDILEEFAGKVSDGTDLQGTVGETEMLLSGVVPPEQIADIMADLRGNIVRNVWPRLSQMPETPVAQYIVKEHPQVAAFILSKASPAAAASVLELVPNELRKELMRRMLSMKNVMDLPLVVLEFVLNDELLHNAGNQSGPNIHARIADIINRMPREQMDEVFSNLSEFRPKEAEKVKGLLFTFDDIMKLSPASVAKLFDQVPPERVILALHEADAELSELILSALGARSRRLIEQELESGASPTQKDVVKARRAIADLALQLAEKGVIDLHENEDDGGGVA